MTFEHSFKSIPAVSVSYAQTGNTTKSDEMGMRVMQARAFAKRGEQYLLIKSPPASGKSRALMFIALDKLLNQDIKKAIVIVPEKSIGSSFSDEPLSDYGFFADWNVVPKRNLCNAPGEDGSKVKAVGSFLTSDDDKLVCTHATFRFAVDRLGIAAFDNCLLAVDEFHHVSADEDNILGTQLNELIARDKVHIVAMTGSYFRGDTVPILLPENEEKFETVTYTYYEQLNGYEHLKSLDIGYYFYNGSYVDDILKVLDPSEKTIVHIPSPNARESTGDKIREVEFIMSALGEWQERNPDTGFQIIKTEDGRTLKIADLVDDSRDRDKVSAALKDPEKKSDRNHVDIIIALGMAKEGFDWIWCEHALTIGYRASLTEVVQIIGRATRDAPDKTRARFTNLIAEPDAAEQTVTEAVNDTLKAIAASLLMEQVLAPKFNFVPKTPESSPTEGLDYGENGYDPNRENVGVDPDTGQFQIELKGLVEPKSDEAKRICKEDINEVIAAFMQDKSMIERGMFDEELVPEEITQVRAGKIISKKYPSLDKEDVEAVRQDAIAKMAIMQEAKKVILEMNEEEPKENTALIRGIRKFAMDVRELDVDLIDSINPFSAAYSVLAKTMTEESLKGLARIIAGRRVQMDEEEANALLKKAVNFKRERGRNPDLNSTDPWERRIAEGMTFMQRIIRERSNA